MNVNKTFLCGRLTKDPTVRATQSGKTVAMFSLATSQTWTDKAGVKQEKASFHNIVMWGRLAEIAGQYLTKGQECFVEGRLETRSYADKANVQRYVTEIVAEAMQMGAKPRTSYEQEKSATSASVQPAQQEDIPTINLDDEKKSEPEPVIGDDGFPVPF